ncbi:hypothetical protein [Pseudooceanicola sp. HF7]|uniref:hypothetical protein n=1 Tax=Pseudooceanicola sp. HF7 TaxID=2721560 RepID=UPI001430F606|nr:hypothetical protein [Pseudooceanicola sp. HF7]NIZ10478.1 hypothetical protein [Pseudooceanicola sp. HF7]
MTRLRPLALSLALALPLLSQAIPGQAATGYSQGEAPFSADGLSSEEILQLEYALLLTGHFSRTPDGTWSEPEDRALKAYAEDARGIPTPSLLDIVEGKAEKVVPTNREAGTVLWDYVTEWDGNGWADKYYGQIDKTISTPLDLIPPYDPDREVAAQLDSAPINMLLVGLADDGSWHDWLLEVRDPLYTGHDETANGERVTSGRALERYNYYHSFPDPDAPGSNLLLVLAADDANRGRAFLMAFGMRDGSQPVPALPADGPLHELIDLAQ